MQKKYWYDICNKTVSLGSGRLGLGLISSNMMVNYDMNNNNKFFAISSNGFATSVLPHCAECMVVSRRFAPLELDDRGQYSDPVSGVYLASGFGFSNKPKKKGYNLIKFELSEFSRQQKRKLFCKAA